MRRDRLTITSASSRGVAPADRRSGDAKVRASQAAHLSGCTSLGPFRFPQTRRPTAAHLLCDAVLLVPALSFEFYRVFTPFNATILTTLSSREYFLPQTQSAGELRRLAGAAARCGDLQLRR